MESRDLKRETAARGERRYLMAAMAACALSIRQNAHVSATLRPFHHNVYVVELSRDVLREARFMRANPHYLGAKPCVYVGMTGLSPDERFDKHKAGIKANKFVRLYGLRLLPDLYEPYNPMPYLGAQEMEVELGISLREEGYAVWQG